MERTIVNREITGGRLCYAWLDPEGKNIVSDKTFRQLVVVVARDTNDLGLERSLVLGSLEVPKVQKFSGTGQSSASFYIHKLASVWFEGSSVPSAVDIHFGGVLRRSMESDKCGLNPW